MVIHLIAILYAFSVLWLSAYGLHGWILTLLYWRHRRRSQPTPTIPRDQLPAVTVQLPLYNEAHVAARLIDAAAALDYPRDRLEIQVLDDSTDETVRIVDGRVAFHRQRGVDIRVLRRSERDGFKAGALVHGLKEARGEIIAIFDADFCPRPDFL
ncbi:MAG TPA: glycosyltransferase, partial [Anaerolineae bacterium]|nr:glycosyltransferase [Anaerolineae bacterium]